MIHILVATDPNGVIGKDGAIPWRMAEDMRLFKERTMGHCVVMGRKTWESLPYRPLPGRANFVVSRSPTPKAYANCTLDGLSGPVWCSSLGDALGRTDRCRSLAGPRETYIIGGSEIYKISLECNFVDQIILSLLDECHDGDRFFHVPNGWVTTRVEPYAGFSVLYFVKADQTPKRPYSC